MPRKLIRITAVADMLGINRATVYRWLEANPAFPRPFKLSPRRVLFDADEVEAFLIASKVVA